MKRLEVNPRNEKYYTQDFISGFRCGTRRQLESDLAVIEKIREEVRKQNIADFIAVQSVLEIIDEYKECRDTKTDFYSYLKDGAKSLASDNADIIKELTHAGHEVK